MIYVFKLKRVEEFGAFPKGGLEIYFAVELFDDELTNYQSQADSFDVELFVFILYGAKHLE